MAVLSVSLPQTRDSSTKQVVGSISLVVVDLPEAISSAKWRSFFCAEMSCNLDVISSILDLIDLHIELNSTWSQTSTRRRDEYSPYLTCASLSFGHQLAPQSFSGEVVEDVLHIVSQYSKVVEPHFTRTA